MSRHLKARLWENNAFLWGQCFSIGQCLSMAFELLHFASFWTLFVFDLRRFSLYTEKQVQMGVLNKEKRFKSNSIEMHCPIEKHCSIGKHCPHRKTLFSHRRALRCLDISAYNL